MAFVARASKPNLPGIKAVSVKHEAILNFLVAHPCVKLRDVAQHFGVSQPWLSMIIHSDAFQRLLRQRQDIHFDHSILPMMDRMHLVVEQAIDRMLEIVDHETDLSKLNQVVDKGLNRFGYGTSATPATQLNVQVNVDAEALARARQLIGAGPRLPALEGTSLELRHTEEVSTVWAGGVGQDDSAPALSLEASEDSAGAAGGPI